MADDSTTPTAVPAPLSPRDALRATVFSAKTHRVKTEDFYGAKIELRQPSINQTFATREGDDQKIAMVWSLIDCAYIPGTNEKAFTPEDYDSLSALPMDQDFIRISRAIVELTGANLSDSAGSSNKGQKPTS